MSKIVTQKVNKPELTDGMSRPGSRNGWWFADCPKHGRTAHMDVIGGNCCLCQHERIEADNATRKSGWLR